MALWHHDILALYGSMALWCYDILLWHFDVHFDVYFDVRPVRFDFRFYYGILDIMAIDYGIFSYILLWYFNDDMRLINTN